LALLEVKGLTKYFGGLMAVGEVDIAVEKGEVRGLIGPNGSGKTTIFNLVTGFYRPTSGSIRFKERNIVGLSPQRICRLGIGRTFQIAKPFHSMTVIQNTMVAAIYGKSGKGEKDPEKESVEILKLIELYEKRSRPVTSLTLADRKRLELARALATGPELLLLDETVAGLNAVEVDAVIEQLRKIRGMGVTIFMIEHVMRPIMTLSDRVTVIHHGKKIAEGKPSDIVNDKNVIDAYLGTEAVA